MVPAVLSVAKQVAEALAKALHALSLLAHELAQAALEKVEGLADVGVRMYHASLTSRTRCALSSYAATAASSVAVTRRQPRSGRVINPSSSFKFVLFRGHLCMQ
jgi:hypothetical protein